MNKMVLAVILSGFAGIGIAHIFNPSWFVRRSGVRKGGELLNDWNELGFQIVGVIFAAAALYGLYLLFRSN
jgi:H+/Cl- antiporter ClcA